MSVNAEILNITDEFVSLYNENLNEISKDATDFINEKRAKAFEHFKSLGIPAKRDEKYRYTNMQEAFNSDYNKHFAPKKIDFEINDIFKCDIPELDTNVLLLLNGWYHNSEEKLKTLPNGVIMGSLAEASKKYPEIVEKHYSKYAEDDKDGLTALNTSFAQDGIFIYIPKGVVLEKPIQVINMLMAGENLMVQHRNLIVAEENTQAKIVVCDHTLSPHKFLTNSVTEIAVNENAHLGFFKQQNEHNNSTQISSVFINQKANSNVKSNIITLHGGLVRNNIEVIMDGEGCENNTSGLFLADKTQHVDNYSNIVHAKPNCTSYELFKGVLDDSATGAFNGRVLVAQGAQNTQAYQANNNILLTDDAKMKTKPQLEIYANDVKCSHGATIGQLDESAMFYMQARGIGKKEARLLLMYAFAHEVIKEIDIEPLKERIDDLVDKRLRGELSRCNNCTMSCG